MDQIERVPVGPVYSVHPGPLRDAPFALEHDFDAVRDAFRERSGRATASQQWFCAGSTGWRGADGSSIAASDLTHCPRRPRIGVRQALPHGAHVRSCPAAAIGKEFPDIASLSVSRKRRTAEHGKERRKQNRTPARGEEAMAGEHESVMVIRSVGLRRVARQLPQIPGGPR